MSSVEYGVVVAGYDGSDEARLATLWAAGEAADRGCGLVVVQAITWPIPGPVMAPGPPPLPAGTERDEVILREQAEQQLADMAEECRHYRPKVHVETQVVAGRPAEELGRIGRDAELVVIGSSGRTGLPRVLLGATAAELVHDSDRPVVIVRQAKELAGLPAPRDGGRVVVGVDGSETSARAIDFAGDFADRHGCELVAVHAWSDLPMDALAPVRAWDQDWHEVREKGERLLAKSLAGMAEAHPDVRIRYVVSFDRPAHALMEHAEGAALLVVGSHGRGALRRALLGSVSHAVSYHAPCPVAVVRAPRE